MSAKKNTHTHIRTPGDEGEPVCNQDVTYRGFLIDDHALTWSIADATCAACLRRVRTRPQLFNAIMAARQTSIPGAE